MKATRKTRRKINRLFIELKRLEPDVEDGLEWSIARKNEIIEELDKIYIVA